MHKNTEWCKEIFTPTRQELSNVIIDKNIRTKSETGVVHKGPVIRLSITITLSTVSAKYATRQKQM